MMQAHAGNAGCAREDIAKVGSAPAGQARFGHLHLAGSMREWVFDRYQIPTLRAPATRHLMGSRNRSRSGPRPPSLPGLPDFTRVVGAHAVQIDFTEGRLAVKIDPSGALLHSFIELNNLALARFSSEDRKRIGVHTCPGGDRDSTHSADVDYAELLPSLFQLQAGNFYVALVGERDPVRALKIIRDNLKPAQRVFVGVVAPIDPHIETPEEVRDRVMEAARYIPLAQLGTTDDCGFSPFCDDVSTNRDTAFAKIRARVLGTALADDATRQIRAQAWGRSVSIIALTGWGQTGDTEKSRAAGCNGYLVKPVTLEQLESCSRTCPWRETRSMAPPPRSLAGLHRRQSLITRRTRTASC